MRNLVSIVVWAGAMACLLLVATVRVAGEDLGKLHLVILDRRTGRTVPARCYLTDSTGRPWAPAGVITYVHPPEQNFVTSGEFQLDLPPGKYTVRIERGPEYSEAEQVVTIRPGETCGTKVEVEHLIDINQRHWYSGDLHVHRDLQDVPEILVAEDINIAPIITAWFSGDHMTHAEDPSTGNSESVRVIDPKHAYSTLNAEVERPHAEGAGTVDMLALDRPIDFRNTSLLAPPDLAFTKQTHERQGYVDAEKILYRDTAALVALGQIDFAGIVHNWFTRYGVIQADPAAVGMIPRSAAYATPSSMPLWAMDIYYHFLNCGFKLPVSAGSASGVLPNPVGFNRVYVHLPAQPAFREWFQALKAGRNFATNGPMLFLTVNGHDLGDTIEVPTTNGTPARALTVEAEVISTHDLDRLEIIWKGKLVKTVAAVKGDRTLRVRFEFDPKESGWIAARAFEKVREVHPAPYNHPVLVDGVQSVADIPSHGWATAPTPRFAHTSPIYVIVGDHPAHDPESAQFFLAWIDREIRHFETLSGFPTEADRDQMLAMFRKARPVYEKLARTANSE